MEQNTEEPNTSGNLMYDKGNIANLQKKDGIFNK